METPTTRDVVLIDLSSIAYPIWHTSASDPNPDATSIKTVERVRALASGQPHVAICCDAGKSFRSELAPTYKANRFSEDRAIVHHQINLAMQTLRGDGFPVWVVKGFEADDLIASAANALLAQDERSRVVIVSADKDLLQLVCDRISVKSLKDGSLLDAEAVRAKFGVRPDQVRDYLTLVGDTSDNIKGADGIGPKTAAALLTEFGTLDAIYAAIDAGLTPTLTPARRTALQNLRPHLPLTRQLITLRLDAPVPCAEVFAPRVPIDAAPESAATFEEEEGDIVDTTTGEVMSAPPVTEAPAAPEPREMAVRPADIVPAPPVEWERQLEPRTLGQAHQLAKALHVSRLFSAYGAPEGVMATILAGRELGLNAMASLRAFHIVEGKPTMASDTLRALVLRSGMAEYFRCTERTPTRATFVTKRKGDTSETALSYTIEEATAAGVVKAGSSWVKNPADMLVARASAKLARLVYPDIAAGLYAPEEFEGA